MAEGRQVPVVVRETPRDLHLRRDGAHDVGAGEERDLVDGVAIGRVAHRHRQVVLGVEGDRDRAQLDRHVARDRGDHLDRQPRERVRVDLWDQEPRAIEVGQVVIRDHAGLDELLADRAAGVLHARTRLVQGTGWNQPRANQ